MKRKTKQKTIKSIPKKAKKKKIKKSNYGKYLLILIGLAGTFQFAQQFIAPHSLSPLLALSIIGLSIIFDAAVVCFLVLWIMNLIKRRGGAKQKENKNKKEREKKKEKEKKNEEAKKREEAKRKEEVKKKKNKKVKPAISVIFSVLTVVFLIGIAAVFFINNSSNKPVADEQTDLLNKFLQEQEELAVLNDKIKMIRYGLVSAESDRQLNEKMNNLLSTAQKLQTKIDYLKLFIEKNSATFQNEGEKRAIAILRQVINLQDQHNKKLIELTELGLKINFGDSNETERKKSIEIASDLSFIEMAIQVMQTDLQSALRVLSR